MLKRTLVTAALMALSLVAALEYKSIAQPRVVAADPTTGASKQNRTNLSTLDRQFFIQAAQGGIAEVMLGELALRQASSQSVRDYAQQMINDHTQANNELLKLATAKGVVPPRTPNATQLALMNLLSTLSGSSFDTAYMNEAGVRSHAEQEVLYQRAIEFGQDPDVRAFATKVLPIVQKHLQMARDMTNTSTQSRLRD